MSGVRIAIDGPSGVGKSTTARAVARRLGVEYVDTGAMYRAVGVIARRRGVDLDDADAVARVAEGLRFAFPEVDDVLHVEVDGERLTDAIRTEQASLDASSVSRHPGVRAALVAVQRALAARGGVVMEGRDIGTAVIPDAEVKVFLDADPVERGQRRLGDLRSRGADGALDEVVRDLARRDHQDRTRATSPLRQADDALRIDTTELTLDDVVERIVERVRRRTSGPQKPF